MSSRHPIYTRFSIRNTPGRIFRHKLLYAGLSVETRSRRVSSPNCRARRQFGLKPVGSSSPKPLGKIAASHASCQKPSCAFIPPGKASQRHAKGFAKTLSPCKGICLYTQNRIAHPGRIVNGAFSVSAASGRRFRTRADFPRRRPPRLRRPPRRIRRNSLPRRSPRTFP